MKKDVLYNYRYYTILIVLLFSSAGLLLDLFQEWGFTEWWIVNMGRKGTISPEPPSTSNFNLIILNGLTISVYIVITVLLILRKISVKRTTIIYSLILSINIYLAYFWYFTNTGNISNFVLRDLIIFYIIIFIASTCTSTSFTVLIAAVASVFYMLFSILSGDKFLLKNMPVFIMLTGSFAFVFRRIVNILDKSILKQEEEAKRIEELSHFKESLTQMLLHDVKVPLTSIINLSDSGSSPSNIKKINYHARKTVRMLSNMIDVESGNKLKIKLENSMFAVSELIKESVEQVQIHALEKNIYIHNTINNDIVIKGDKDLLERTIINILENAVKYSGKNSNINIYVNDDNENVYLSVADEGRGINPGEIHKVFELFYTSGLDDMNEKSSGIGLTFCKIVVEAHGGKITVKSDINKGSTFILSLPLSAQINRESVSKAKNDFLSVSKETLTIVRPVVNKLKKISYYQTSEILAILNSIPVKDEAKYNEELEIIKEAALSCNEEIYNKLLKFIT